ncbi:hypothetical protein BDV26DRAFT_275291 [Aspergillus bertholletiae]|uniref:Uncharacterized protein n=1 Tax=Aspergillus bertholletiae TaxID=1226010 RepID=A0A5N7APS8_9EURO|nr:hypothetical protein BDV26DRAFT_275291 [Aspergillus bertholletiae]
MGKGIYQWWTHIRTVISVPSSETCLITTRHILAYLLVYHLFCISYPTIFIQNPRRTLFSTENRKAL